MKMAKHHTKAPGMFWNVHPWKYSKFDWMGSQETWSSFGIESSFEVGTALSGCLETMTSKSPFQTKLLYESWALDMLKTVAGCVCVLHTECIWWNKFNVHSVLISFVT